CGPLVWCACAPPWLGLSCGGSLPGCPPATGRSEAVHRLIVGIDHIQLAMPAGRADEAREFYARILGISERSKPAELAKRGGVWFENGAVKIHLGVEAGFRPARKAHPALLVRRLPLLVKRLRD